MLFAGRRGRGPSVPARSWLACGKPRCNCRAASRFLGLLSQYLQHQVDLGRLRPHDTMIAARSFLGMFVVNVVTREIMRDPVAMATPDEQLIATALDIFLGGLEVAEE